MDIVREQVLLVERAPPPMGTVAAKGRGKGKGKGCCHVRVGGAVPRWDSPVT